MKHLAGLKLTARQHDQLVRVCASALMFPQTYEEWLQIVARAEEEAVRCGVEVHPIQMEVDDFLSWCRMVGIVPCIDAMKAYAIVQRLTSSATVLGVPPAISQTSRETRSA